MIFGASSGDSERVRDSYSHARSIKWRRVGQDFLNFIVQSGDRSERSRARAV